MRTVAGELEKALLKTKAGTYVPPVYPCGRTDAGTHALAQTCHVDFQAKRDTPLPAKSFEKILMSNLDSDVRKYLRVVQCSKVDSNFHARFSCSRRHYVYRIAATPSALTSQVSTVFEPQTAWQVDWSLDIPAFLEAQSYLQGKHDFAAFQSTGSSEVPTTVRDVTFLSN